MSPAGHPDRVRIADTALLRSIGLMLRSIHVDFRQSVDVALHDAGLGITFAEVSPLMSLDLEPGINGAELARQCLVSAQAMNTVLRALAAKRYMERRPHPRSLRADSWYLTAEGSRLLEKVRQILNRTTLHMLQGLSAPEVRELERALQCCTANLKGAAGPAAE